MKTICDTQKAGVSFAIDALKLYYDGEYEQAISKLSEVVNSEPNNWHARLMLGASYYNADNLMAARREFQYIYKKCPDLDFVRMSIEGFRATFSEKVVNLVDVAPEFGCYIDLNPSTRKDGWLGETQKQASPKSFSQRKTGWYIKLTDRFMHCLKLTNPILLHPLCHG